MKDQVLRRSRNDERLPGAWPSGDGADHESRPKWPLSTIERDGVCYGFLMPIWRMTRN